MSIRELQEFLFLCKMAGFTTCKEVSVYMDANGINCRELFNELNESKVRVNGMIATKYDIAIIERRIRSGFGRITAKYRNGIIYYQFL